MNEAKVRNPAIQLYGSSSRATRPHAAKPITLTPR